MEGREEEWERRTEEAERDRGETRMKIGEKGGGGEGGEA